MDLMKVLSGNSILDNFMNSLSSWCTETAVRMPKFGEKCLLSSPQPSLSLALANQLGRWLSQWDLTETDVTLLTFRTVMLVSQIHIILPFGESSEDSAKYVLYLWYFPHILHFKCSGFLFLFCQLFTCKKGDPETQFQTVDGSVIRWS